MTDPLGSGAIPHRPLKPAYDYIVVGSGSGGSVVARRLVDAGADVLLIEAGPSDIGVAEIADPAAWMSLGRGAYDWGYDYAPTADINGRIIGLPRGKVLGGSSAINAMMWYRGHPADYDAWDDAGACGWAFKDVLPYFKKCEDWEGGANDWRGAGGPLRISRSPDMHPLAEALIGGAGELGIPHIDDPNGASNEGAAASNFNIASGRRWSSAQGYLGPVLYRNNLTVLTQSLAVGLGFTGSRCTSVHHMVDGVATETGATCEIVLALGAIDTPRLLTLSGIGDPDDLHRLGIAVRAALPGVGQNLQDHPLVRAVNFKAKRPLGAVRDNGGGSMVNWKTTASATQPNALVFPVQGRSAVPDIANAYDLSGDVFALGVGLTRSRSRGFLRVLGSELNAPIEIQPRFLSEPRDLDDLIVAVDWAMNVAGTRAYADWFGGFTAPGRRLDRNGLAGFIRTACSTFFHACGTAKMGSDEMAVVDSMLAVRGVTGLRIADASVMPIIPSCHTHAPVTMIGERAADFILRAA